MDNNIKITDYLSDEEMKEIARNSFRDHCDRQFSSKFGNKENLERIISNIGHEVAYSIVEEHFGDNIDQLIEQKAIEVINQLSPMEIFRAPDAWQNEASKGWEFLQESLESNKHLIDERVKELFKDVPMREIIDFVQESAAEIIEERLFGKTNQSVC